MPVPTTMADLSLAAASNSPAGADSIGNTLDDFIRSHASIVRSIYTVSAASIASAATTNIANSTGEHVVITGTTTITSFGTGYIGCRRELNFAAAL